MTTSRWVSSLLLPILAAALFPSAAAGYEVISVSDGGTIKGKVVYQGTVPTKKIIPTKDKDTCGETREEPEIVARSSSARTRPSRTRSSG